MGWIKRAWNGEERLWKVFWIYGFLLGVILQVASVATLYAFGIIAYLLPAGLQIVNVIWVAVAEWKCAFNTNRRFWGYAVRGLVGLYVITILGAAIVFDDFMAVLDLRNSMARNECEIETKAYAARGGANLEAFKQLCIKNHSHRTASFFSDSNTLGDAITAPANGNQKPSISETSDLNELSATGKLDAYFIVQYIRARESYVLDTLAENYDVIRLMTTPEAYRDFVIAMDPHKPQSNAARFGQNGTRRVKIKSLTFVQPQLAEVHFVISEKSVSATTPVECNKVAQIEFEFVKMNLNASERFINPAGFRVIQYHLNDESEQK